MLILNLQKCANASLKLFWTPKHLFWYISGLYNVVHESQASKFAVVKNEPLCELVAQQKQYYYTVNAKPVLIYRLTRIETGIKAP